MRALPFFMLTNQTAATVRLCLSTSRTDCIQWISVEDELPKLCLSTSRTDCIDCPEQCGVNKAALPQHIPHGLHQQKRTDTML